MLAISRPYHGGAAVTTSDTTDMTRPANAIMVTAGGAVKVDTQDGSTLTLPGLVVGTIYPIAARRIYTTGTTATGIIALY